MLRREERYRKNVLHGAFKTFHPNGRAEIRGAYKDGLLHGKHVTHDPKGRPAIKADYAKGKLDGKYEKTQPYKHGVKHAENGGVTLSFWDGGVRLTMVDMEGRKGQPGEASQPDHLALFCPLAIGETWGVNKKGEVTVK